MNNKKLFALLLCFSLFTSNFFTTNVLAETTDVRNQQPVYLFFNGFDITNFFVEKPVIVNNRTLVPIREVFEGLGAVVNWNGNDKTVYINNSSTTVILQIDSNIMIVNNVNVILDSSPTIINGKTMLPLRAVSEAFGLDVTWDNQTRVINVIGRLDSNSFNIDGFDSNSFNADGFDSNGFDSNGFDSNGFDSNGFDSNGFDSNGFNIDGFDSNGFNVDGFDSDGFNVDGFDSNGFNVDGFDSSYYDDDKSLTNVEFELEVFRLTNIEREKEGVSPLKLHGELSDVATLKSKDMYDNSYFDHTSPTYGSPFDMLDFFGIEFTYAGENIAWGQRTPSDVINSWMNSPGHRENILDSSYGNIGIGYYNKNWTQMFTQ